ncbi:hypothetical protein WJN01_02790 [Flavobacteriaceae bacterium SZ-1-7]|uniref:hypothetical protein n=1 Tax=Tamlana sedimenti TaxID=3134126 RepID=UPI0031277AF9
MLKQIVSILLTTLFLLFLMAPTVISIIDDSVDVSVFYTTSEEEEKGGKKTAEKELLYCNLEASDLKFSILEDEHNLEYCAKKYPNPHLKLTSPPPRLHIL